MQASLLEILRSIPDHRRAEGRRFDLATVSLYAILAMVAGAHSSRYFRAAPNYQRPTLTHRHISTNERRRLPRAPRAAARPGGRPRSD